MENTIGTSLGNLVGTTAKKLGLVDVIIGLREGAALPHSDAEEERRKTAGSSAMLNTMITAVSPAVLPILQEWLSKEFLGKDPEQREPTEHHDPDTSHSTITVTFNATGIAAEYENTPFAVKGAKSVHEALRRLATLLEEDYNKSTAAEVAKAAVGPLTR
jgi:hypothetical protein